MYENQDLRVRGRTKTSIEEYVEKYNTNLISFEDSSESSRLIRGGGNFESIEKYRIFYILLRKNHEVAYFLIYLPYSLLVLAKNISFWIFP